MSASSTIASSLSTISASSRPAVTYCLGDRTVKVVFPLGSGTSASTSSLANAIPSVTATTAVASGVIGTIQASGSILEQGATLSEAVTSKLPYLQALSIPLIPFHLISLGKDMLAISAADSFKRFGRRVLEFTSNTSDLISSVISAANFFHFIRVVRSISFLPILEIVLVPLNAVRTVLDFWDTFRLAHTFVVITKQTSRRIETTEQAKEALEALKAHGIRRIGARLDTSKESLEGKIDLLFSKVADGQMDASAILETQKLMEALKGRVNVKLGLTVARTALSIVTLTGSILAVAMPAAPVAGVVLSGVGSMGTFAISAGEALFLTDDILDPNAKTKVMRIVDKVQSVATTLRVAVTGLVKSSLVKSPSS